MVDGRGMMDGEWWMVMVMVMMDGGWWMVDLWVP
jgi:hypothetical protein